MITKFIAVAASLLIPVSAVPAAPTVVHGSASVPAPTTAGCLLVSNLVAKNATELKDRNLAQATLQFFLGRIDDRTTPQQLRSELHQQGHLITQANATVLMNACLHQMQAKSQMLQSVAEQLQQRK